MSQVTVTAPMSVSANRVAKSRAVYVEFLGKIYGAGKQYATDLLEYFTDAGFGTEWLDMAHDAKGPSGDAMRTERDALYEDLRKAGHSNPSVKWKQIKDHARAILAEQNPAPEGEGEGEGEDEGEGGNTKHTRSMQLRLIQDLCTLHKACKREARTLTEQQRQASVHIASALTALGVDLNGL